MKWISVLALIFGLTALAIEVNKEIIPQIHIKINIIKITVRAPSQEV